MLARCHHVLIFGYPLPLLCLLFLAAPVYADMAAPYTLSSESPAMVNITPFSEYLLDEAHKLNTLDPAGLAAEPWQQTAAKSYLQLGIGESAHWIRIGIDNINEQTQKRLLELTKPLIDSVEITVVNSAGTTHYQLGAIQPFDDRVIKYRNLVVPITLPAGETTEVYLRLQTSKILTFSIRLLTRQALEQQARSDLFMSGLYLGMMLFVACFAAYRWLRHGEPAQLYLCLVTLGFILFNATQSGLGYQFLWPENPWLNNLAPTLSTNLTAIFGTLFGVAFLSRFHFPELARRWLLVMAAANGLLFLAAMGLPYGAVVKLALLTAFATMLLTIASAIGTTLRYRKHTTTFLLGWLALCLGAFISLMHLLGVISPSQFAEHSILIGSALAPMLWTLAMSDQLEFEESIRLEAQSGATRQAEQRESELRDRLRIQEDENRGYKHMLKKADRLDGVTGLLNITAFHQEMEREHRSALRHGTTLCVVALEISDLPDINESAGHRAGDAYVAAVARVIAQSLQRPGDLAGRITGSRLGIVLPYTDIDGALEVLQRVKAGVQAWRQSKPSAPAALKLRAGIASTENRLARHADDLIESAMGQIREISE